MISKRYLMDNEELLKDVDLFSDLEANYIKDIANFCVRRSFKEGDIILKQGEPGIGLFIIASGKVKVIKELAHGGKMEVSVHGPREFIGEMSVLDNAPRSASVIALENTDCLVLTAWDFKSRLKARSEIALELLPVVVKRFIETNEKLLTFSRI